MWSFLVLMLISLCNADKLNRLYLPPPNANLSGGRSDDLQVPKQTFLDQNQDDILENLQTANPNRKFLDFYSSTVPPTTIYNEFLNPTTEQILTKSNLPVDERFKNTLNVSPKVILNQNNAPTDKIYGPGSNYGSTTALPKPSRNTFNKFASTLPNEVITNIDDASFSTSPISGFNSKQLPDGGKFDTFTDPSLLINSGNKNKNLFLKYPQPLNNDKFRSKYPNIDVSNENQYPERIQAEADRQAVILNYENQLNPDSYAYSFDTSNGIHGDENGTTVDGTRAQGSYSYTGDDGKLYNVTYTADENGFQPRGDHLPTPPPLPEAIQAALKKIAENERNGIFDDGSYDENKYGYKNYGSVPNGKRPFNQPVSKYDRGYFDTTSKNTPYIKPTASSTKPYNDLGGSGNINEDYDEYDTTNSNKYFDPSNQEELTKISPLQNERMNLPTLTRGQDSVSPANNIKSYESRTLPKSYPSSTNGNKINKVYSTSQPLTEGGYQNFAPTDRIVSKFNTLPPSIYSKTDGFTGVIPSTTSPFTTVLPQEYIVNGNRFDISQPNNDLNLISPDVLRQFLINQKNPSLKDIQNNENINELDRATGKNYEDENYSSGPGLKEKVTVRYDENGPDSNKDFNVNVPKELEFGQKIYDPLSNYGDDSRYFSTTPIPSQYFSNKQTYNPLLVKSPDGKLGFSTTFKPNIIRIPGKSNVNVNSPYSITNDGINVEDIIDEYENKINDPNTQQDTYNTKAFPGIKKINSNYNSPQSYTESPNDLYEHSEKITGEDFSGPKQPQSYDPITGYHY